MPPLGGRIRHNRLLPARQGEQAAWPDWVAGDVRTAWQRRGIERPWRHQVEAADAVHGGRHVVITTGTASGKSLGYLLPILAATAQPSIASGPAAPTARPTSARPSPPQESLFDETPPEPVPDSDPVLEPQPALEPALEPALGPVLGPAAGPALGPVAGSVAGPVAGPAAAAGAAAWRRRPHTALYLAPTKALAHDQLRRCTELGLDRWRIAAVGGDTSPDERDWARDYAAFLLTNPDLLHYSLLPGHARWRGLLQTLRYVVVDEAHIYRGVFGAQVAQVLRRLRRLAAHYGSDPTFVLASATAGDAVASASALTGVAGENFLLVDRDSSARGSVAVQLWQPDDTAEGLTAELLTEEVRAGRQAIAFVSSRRATETIALQARAALQSRDGAVGSAGSVEAYRGGYLDTDRRRIEADLQTGRLRGVAATNALELGVDIAGVDTVVICGFPSSRSALWQQAGRAGRRGNDAAVRLVARRQPLDAYLLEHPDALLDGHRDVTVLHPDNPAVLGPQLAAAAQELPLTDDDRTYFGEPGLQLVELLVAAGRLRRRPDGCYWTRPGRAVDQIDLRSSRGDAVEIVEEETGRVLGHVDGHAADRVVHHGAVYLHLGETYVCEEWEPGDREALVRASRPGFWTQPQVRSDVEILVEHAARRLGAGRIHLGDVVATSQVTAYLRRDQLTGDVWDSTPLDLPERRTRATAVWWTLDESVLPAALNGVPARLDAGVHAAEHACIGMLPAFAPCDRWDVGAHSDPRHRQTDAVTVFVHDEQGGGTGFAARAFSVADEWLRAGLERIEGCDCELGCPACILTGCGSNRGLDRAAGTAVLRHLLD